MAVDLSDPLVLSLVLSLVLLVLSLVLLVVLVLSDPELEPPSSTEKADIQ